MKTLYLFLIIAAITLNTGHTFAQRGHQNRDNDRGKYHQRECRINDLTDEQQEQIKAEHVKFSKETLADKNKLNELRAKKRTIETTEPYNAKEMNKLLSEMNTLSANIHKKKIRHHQNIKSFLTDEQIISWESKAKGQCNQPFGMARGNKPHMHQKMEGKNKHHGNRHPEGKGRAMVDDELKQMIKDSHMAYQKEAQPLENKLNELNAQLKTATTGKNIDLKKADKLVDEQSQIRLELAKLKAQSKASVYAQLSDEQKVMFGRHPKMGRGMHTNGRCFN